jgi:hypothetical protein
MRFAFAFVSLSLLVGACSGNDTSSPAAACNSLANTLCNKLSSCNLLGSTTVAACISGAEAAASCATLTCPAGKSFNSGAASQCLSDLGNESCTDVGNQVLPTSCQAIENGSTAACQ